MKEINNILHDRRNEEIDEKQKDENEDILNILDNFINNELKNATRSD